VQPHCDSGHLPVHDLSDIENGQRRVTVSDFIAFSEALHFDVRSAIRRIADVKPKPG
jgi:hypothetical protein